MLAWTYFFFGALGHIFFNIAQHAKSGEDIMMASKTFSLSGRLEDFKEVVLFWAFSMIHKFFLRVVFSFFC